MQSHYETYRGWSVSVQISAHLSRIDIDRKLPDYIPRIVVTEHLDNGFNDREVADGHSYPTEEECIAHGIRTAHEYIDGKTSAARKAVRH
jgi:hypothetical protein